MAKWGDFGKHLLITSIQGYKPKNASRKKFLHSPDIGACKVSSISNGSFPRSLFLPPPLYMYIFATLYDNPRARQWGPPRPRPSLWDKDPDHLALEAAVIVGRWYTEGKSEEHVVFLHLYFTFCEKSVFVIPKNCLLISYMTQKYFPKAQYHGVLRSIRSTCNNTVLEGVCWHAATQTATK